MTSPASHFLFLVRVRCWSTSEDVFQKLLRRLCRCSDVRQASVSCRATLATSVGRSVRTGTTGDLGAWYCVWRACGDSPGKGRYNIITIHSLITAADNVHVYICVTSRMSPIKRSSTNENNTRTFYEGVEALYYRNTFVKKVTSLNPFHKNILNKYII